MELLIPAKRSVVEGHSRQEETRKSLIDTRNPFGAGRRDEGGITLPFKDETAGTPSLAGVL